MNKNNEESIFDKVDNEIHWWTRYNPSENQYIKYIDKPYTILAGFQIESVYDTLCTARANLAYTQCNDFGELIGEKNDLHISFIKSRFIQNSIIYYNICTELSWQVLWVFYNSCSNDLLYNDKLFDNMLKKCTYYGVLYKLTLAREFKLKQIIEDFYGYLNECGIREVYNYIKHKGTFYYEKLGNNYNEMMFSYNGIRPKLKSRKEINIKDMMIKLIEFDNKFTKYFSIIIKYIMPKDYLLEEICLEDMIKFFTKQ